MKRISTHLVIIFVLLFQSCIKEEFSTCESELLLRFRYTLNNTYDNLFGLEVSRMAVYIFDSNDKYVGTFVEQGNKLNNEYIMRIPLPEGKYSAVALGGPFNTYTVGELDEQTNAINETLRKGVTDLKDFRTELHHVSGAENYLYPRYTPDDLYVGLSTNSFSTINNQHVVDIELTQNAKKINVKVTGTDATGTALDVHITALNGRYHFDNDIDMDHGTFKYMPINPLTPVSQYTPGNRSLRSNTMEVDLKMMRLVVGQAPMLVIKNKLTSETIYNENMIEQIFETEQFQDQEDFDREDKYAFEILVVNDVVVSVSINGWKVININPDL